ncbi:MAG: ABC transporter ATP-binding protein [Candidatus Omnitrophica bacterium]|nr:ABC transporter ATP-binding protein [Candidatus Omnitrophota bacterium]
MEAIRTECLTKIYKRGKVRALNKLDLVVPQDVAFGFLGPNGAGKTTTINLLLSFIEPTEGTAWIFGEEIGSADVKKRIGFLPESPYFYNHLTGVEFLDYFARVFAIPAQERYARIEKLLDMVGLLDDRNKLLRHFSRGMLQRIGIAQALINDPALVIMDEPITGVDPVGRKEVRGIIQKIRSAGKTVFFSSHVLHDVEAMCDHIGILCNGRLIRTGKLEAFLNTNEVQVSATGVNPEGITEIQRCANKISLEGSRVVAMADTHERSGELLDLLRKHGGKAVTAIPVRKSLEEVFLQEIEKVRVEESEIEV